MYTAELHGHSIEGGPVIRGVSLASVKVRAWKALSDADRSLEIRIYEDDGIATQWNLPRLVARRPLSGRRWLDMEGGHE